MKEQNNLEKKTIRNILLGMASRAVVPGATSWYFKKTLTAGQIKKEDIPRLKDYARFADFTRAAASAFLINKYFL